MAPRRWAGLLREPLVHFLALGALLFAGDALRGGGAGASSRIVVAPGQVEVLVAGFERTWQRPAGAAEVEALIDDWVREEIASREASALGLDRGDIVLRRRLRQKLEFLIEDAANAVPPADAELEAWLRAHAEAYRVEPRVSYQQVYLSPERRGAAVAGDAARLLVELRAAPASPQPGEVGDPTLLAFEIEDQARGEVVETFGGDFAAALARAPLGEWTGPAASEYGLHLVRVLARGEARAPALAEVRAEVERDFEADRRRREVDRAYAKLREKYQVVIERPPSGSAGGKTERREPGAIEAATTAPGSGS